MDGEKVMVMLHALALALDGLMRSEIVLIGETPYGDWIIATTTMESSEYDVGAIGQDKANAR